MLPLFILLACGEKAEDTSTEDTAVESDDTATEDTGSGTSEGNEGSNGGAGTNQVWTSDTLNELTSSGGCGDYFVYAKNPDDTLALHISGSGLAMEAHQSPGGMVEYTYTIDPMTDDIQPVIVAQEGLYLNEWSCNDAAMNDPEITLEHMAISGTVNVTVEADGEMTDWGEVPANMTLTLTDVCFDAEVPFCIASHTMNEFIGWLPG